MPGRSRCGAVLAGWLALLAPWGALAQPLYRGTVPAGTFELGEGPRRVVPRADQAVAMLADGTALLTGGSTTVGTLQTRSAETCDADAATCVVTGPMRVPRFQHAATTLGDGRVLVAGGWTHSYVVATASCEIYDPRTRAFRDVGSMHVPRGDGLILAALPDGRAVVAGGAYEGKYGEATDVVEIFDPRTERWTVIGRLQLRRNAYGGRMVDDHRLMLASGSLRCCVDNSARTRTVEMFDLRTGGGTLMRVDQWQPDGIECIAVLADGSMLWTSMNSFTVASWDGDGFIAHGSRAWPTTDNGTMQACGLVPGYAAGFGRWMVVVDTRTLEVTPLMLMEKRVAASITRLRDGRAFLTDVQLDGHVPTRTTWVLRRLPD